MHRFFLILAAVLLAACFGPAVTVPSGLVGPNATLPDTIACDHPLIVHAASERSGINAEHSWIDAHYPGHTQYMQSLGGDGRRKFDILAFQSREGRSISVCFDITSFFGSYD